MITIEQIKKKIQDSYDAAEKRDLFYSIENERKVKLSDDYLNITLPMLLAESAFSYFVEIAKINMKCKTKIEDINDVYFPLKRMSYYSMTGKDEK